jgi:ArsR family transcriptional regulator
MGGLRMDVKTITSCCEPVLTAALSEQQSTELAAAFKVVADPVRLRLLSLVATAPQGEVCACDLVEPLGRSQPTISHHLSVLTDAGLLRREQRGRWAWFSVDPQRLEVLRDALAVTPAGATR